MTPQERKAAIQVGRRLTRVLECRRQLALSERRYAEALRALVRAEHDAVNHHQENRMDSNQDHQTEDNPTPETAPDTPVASEQPDGAGEQASDDAAPV